MSLFGESEPISANVNGKPLCCQVCGNDAFWRREAQLNTAVATFFDFDWANASGICLVCDSCGYIHWFLPRD